MEMCVSVTGASSEPMHIVGGWWLPEENFSTWRKHCSNATLSTTVNAWVALVLNPIFCGEESATDSLSHVMAHKV
jgi:hypothetical protein